MGEIVEALVRLFQALGFSRDVAVNFATDGVVLAITSGVFTLALKVTSELRAAWRRRQLMLTAKDLVRKTLAEHWRLGAVVIELDHCLKAERLDQGRTLRLLRAASGRAENVRKNFSRLERWSNMNAALIGEQIIKFWASDFSACEEIERMAAKVFSITDKAAQQSDPRAFPPLEYALQRWARADIAAARRVSEPESWANEARHERKRVASAWQGGQETIARFWLEAGKLKGDASDSELAERYKAALMQLRPDIDADPAAR